MRPPATRPDTRCKIPHSPGPSVRGCAAPGPQRLPDPLAAPRRSPGGGRVTCGLLASSAGRTQPTPRRPLPPRSAEASSKSGSFARLHTRPPWLGCPGHSSELRLRHVKLATETSDIVHAKNISLRIFLCKLRLGSHRPPTAPRPPASDSARRRTALTPAPQERHPRSMRRRSHPRPRGSSFRG